MTAFDFTAIILFETKKQKVLKMFPVPATSSFTLFISAALVGFESNNKYEVRNSLGQNVFYAVEENDCLNRQCCGPLRPFTIHVLDNFGQEVITVTRPLKCMSCFFPCCLQEVSGTDSVQHIDAYFTYPSGQEHIGSIFKGSDEIFLLLIY